MMRYIILLFASILMSTPLYCQRKTKLNTNGQGTLYGGLNYNRSYYGNSNLNFTGSEFEFNLNKASLHDNPNFNSPYFHSDGLEYFQFSAQIGYFIKNKWALSLGFDRLNIFTPEEFTANIDGVIAPNSSSIEGQYDNDEIYITQNELYYTQSVGTNFASLSINRMDQIYKSKKSAVEVLSFVRLGTGALFSSVDFTFNNITSQRVSSLSGIGFNASIGIRTVFWQSVYLQMNFTGGALNHRNIDLGQNRSLNHVTPYFSPEIGIGFSYFVRPTNNCNTCPQW